MCSAATEKNFVLKYPQTLCNIAIVGATTYGKPVGQFPLDQTGCDVRLRLIAFKNVNRDNEGDYFDGLPDAAFSGKFCAASDDITKPQGDTAEVSVATALHWLNNNACPSPTLRSATSSLTKLGDQEYPMPARPNLAQMHLPGTF